MRRCCWSVGLQMSTDRRMCPVKRKSIGGYCYLPMYIRCLEFPETTKGANKVSDLIRRNAKTLCGTQCLVLKGGEWQQTLTNDLRDHSLYNYNRHDGFKGFDMNLA